LESNRNELLKENTRRLESIIDKYIVSLNAILEFSKKDGLQIDQKALIDAMCTLRNRSKNE
jgi:hypothetical protein